jgi:hypothetical protein
VCLPGACVVGWVTRQWVAVAKRPRCKPSGCVSQLSLLEMGHVVPVQIP